MRCYFRLPEESTRCLIGGYFKTGDLGCIDKHQNIFIHGRLKSQINRAGVKIIPEEIDILFEKHHWVSEACAFAISDNIAGELIGVAVVPSFPKDKKVSDERLIDELREWLKSKISADKVADKIIIVDKIPRNHNGKVSRLELSGKFSRSESGR